MVLEQSTSQPIVDIQETVDLTEIDHCLLLSNNTAPGIDGITSKIIRACWNSIKYVTLRLYQLCLHLGYHPKIFRTAEVTFLPKPNKRDLSSKKSWRPIVLLSCLGKGLERLMAKRISVAAVTHNVISQQQFGALQKHSATDLVGCLIHNIEVARSKGNLASLLTIDVKGAFDTVLPGRLIQRLQEQGWPLQNYPTTYPVSRGWNTSSNLNTSRNQITSSATYTKIRRAIPFEEKSIWQINDTFHPNGKTSSPLGRLRKHKAQQRSPYCNIRN